jgi:hypothetical protein
MKIRTQTDIDNLDKRIQDELGVDIKKYRDEELVANLVELMNFPVYVTNWTLKPILYSFIAFLIGFTLIDLENEFEYVIYTAAGFCLFLSVGGSFGLILLVRKLKLDIWRIIEYAIDLMKSVVSDIDKIKNQISPKSRRRIFTLVFKGIIHIIIIPFWAVAFTEGIPIIGRPIKWIVVQILSFISDQLKLEEISAAIEVDKSKNKKDFLTLQSEIFSQESAQLKKALSFSLNIAQIPLFFYFFVSILFLSILIFILNQ